MSRITRGLIIIILFLLTSPVFLFIYQPAWKLGGLGLVLGGIGYVISPVIIIGTFIYLLSENWRN